MRSAESSAATRVPASRSTGCDRVLVLCRLRQLDLPDVDTAGFRERQSISDQPVVDAV